MINVIKTPFELSLDVIFKVDNHLISDSVFHNLFMPKIDLCFATYLDGYHNTVKEIKKEISCYYEVI